MKRCTHIQALVINLIITTLAIAVLVFAAFYQP